MNLNDILTWTRRQNIYIEITCDTSCSSTRRKSWCTNLHFYASLGFNILKKFSGNKEEILVNFWLYFCMVCIHLWPKFHHYIRWEFKCHSKRCITLNHCRSLLSPLFFNLDFLTVLKHIVIDWSYCSCTTLTLIVYCIEIIPIDRQSVHNKCNYLFKVET